MEQTQNPLRTTAYFFIIIIGLAVTFIILRELGEIFIPLVVAYLMFFVFSPLNNYLKKKNIPEWGAILTDIFILLVLFGGISSIIINSFSQFGEQLPGYEKKLDKIISSAAMSIGLNDPSLTNFHISETLKRIDYKMLAGNLFSSTFSGLGSLLFIIFFFIFVITGHKNIYNAIQKRYNHNKSGDQLIGKKNKDKPESGDDSEEKGKVVQNTFDEITTQVQRYVVTKFFISLITAIVEGGTVWLFGIDFAVVWAVLIFILNFIPNVGSLISLTLPCIMALIQFGSFTIPLTLGIILFTLDTILGNYVEPKIFGESLDLNPLVVLLALLLWGYIWGIVGAVLSVPLTSIIKIMVSKSDSPNLVFISNIMSNNSNGKHKLS
jgi:predicted PurR-regulated permease PerM